MQVAGDAEQLLSLRDDPASIAPERAIVFELAGSVKDFYAQASALGLEYLGDYEEDIVPSDDFHDQKTPEKEIAGRIYLAMPDVRSLQELLSLWRRYQNGQNMPRGKGPWRELFAILVDVRPWGPQDRVRPETISYWRSTLAREPDTPVRFEIELWFYASSDARGRAYQRLRDEIRRLDGVIVHHAVIPEIRYDAALVDIPPEQIQVLIDHPDVTLARVDEILFLRPQSVAHHPRREELEGEEGEEPPAEFELPARDPVAALLDGLPIQNHAKLAGRLIIDDPDDLEPTYAVDLRAHGTEMASLIIHGDLNRGEPPLSRPLFVMPVMRPGDGGTERTPADQLLVDVIYRAVRRIKEGDGAEDPTAPTVMLVNFSLGDEWRPFARVMSPLGRLLDFLAYKYRVLFLVARAMSWID
jgi:hypothetical protein